MSVSVDLDALPAEVSRFGTNPLLVTTSTDGAPHISSVVASFEGRDLRIPVGRTTLRNAAEHPAVALVWMPALAAGFCLIVDAEARGGIDATLVARPKSAVLHRLAGITEASPPPPAP